MNLLTVNNLGFAYPNSPTVFHNVNFHVNPGEVLTVLGPNGVGKSTLLNCLCGLLIPTAGKVTLGSQELEKLSQRQRFQRVAYVPQKYQISAPITVMDFLLTGRTPYLSLLQMPTRCDQELASHYLTEFHLRSLASRPLNSLSGGQQQLVTIIKALLQEPQVLILDEPMAALDIRRQYELLKLIQRLQQRKLSIILTTHLPDHAFMLNDKIGLLGPTGNFMSGSAEALLTRENLEELYQVPLSLTYLPKLHRYTCQLLI